MGERDGDQLKDFWIVVTLRRIYINLENGEMVGSLQEKPEQSTVSYLQCVTITLAT